MQIFAEMNVRSGAVLCVIEQLASEKGSDL
uniref:Transcriptional regulator n=1 Tax=Heterorhabditis bacteriophora TaxID=37862 RepID=A0A1I7XAN3_HETBA